MIKKSHAGVAKLVDALDSKSSEVINLVGVRLPPPAPHALFLAEMISEFNEG